MVKQTPGISARAQPPIVDYSAARERAIKWLGDRYLLAKPINGERRGAATANLPSRRPV